MTGVTGLYINLDRSPDRREHMEKQIAQFGLGATHKRFSGFEGKLLPPDPGLAGAELGAFTSHMRALKAGGEAGGAVHILEDDAVLSAPIAAFAPFMEASGQFEKYDMIFTDTFVHSNLAQIQFLKRAYDKAAAGRARGEADFSMMDLTNQPFCIAASYFVPERSVGKVVAGLEAARKAGSNLSIDLTYRALANQGHIRAACVAPFLSTVRLENIADTTTLGRAGQDGNPTVLALALLRYSFFLEADLPGYARRFLDTLPGPRPGPSGDEHSDVILRVLAFLLSEHFQNF